MAKKKVKLAKGNFNNIKKPKIKSSKKVTKRKVKKSNPIKLKKNWLSKDSEISQLGLSRDGYVCTECGAIAWRPDKIPHKKRCPPESHYLVEEDKKGDRTHKLFGKLGQRPKL